MDSELPGAGTFLAIIVAITGVAMVAIIVSQKAQTSAVLQALGSSTSQVINAAVSPVTSGGSTGQQIGGGV